ncbi:MAG: zinc ABC transporter substrate-binding protein [bacterium]
MFTSKYIRRLKTHAQSIVLLCVLLLLAGCGGNKDSEKPRVVSTTNIVADLVNQLAGDKVEHITLMGPGIDPHLYKAREGDAHRLDKADLIFYSGLHLEAKMQDIFEELSKSKPAIAVTRSIPKEKLMSPKEYEGNYDPHVWFDVSLWQYAVEEVAEGLRTLLPKEATFFTEQEKAYIKKLKQLEKELRKELQAIPKTKRLLITAHDAFTYFGRAYGIKVLGLQGMSTASEAGTKDIQRLTQIILTQEIPCIFVETSVSVRQVEALQAAVEAKGGEVDIGMELFSDALGEKDTPEGTYIGMVKHNVMAIVEGLSRK